MLSRPAERQALDAALLPVTIARRRCGRLEAGPLRVTSGTADGCMFTGSTWKPPILRHIRRGARIQHTWRNTRRRGRWVFHVGHLSVMSLAGLPPNRPNNVASTTPGYGIGCRQRCCREVRSRRITAGAGAKQPGPTIVYSSTAMRTSSRVDHSEHAPIIIRRRRSRGQSARH